MEAREAFFAASAHLHAKGVIADRSSALVTSANLTSAGINDNIGFGVVIEAALSRNGCTGTWKLLMEDETLMSVK